MFKGLGNLGNLAGLVGSFQELPGKMQELNERMKSETVTATSGCQRVEVVMNGVGHVQSVRIDPEFVGAELEEAVLEATNAAGAAAKQMYADAISNMVSEMNLNVPGIDGMLASLTGSK
ncbi:MULTISPECIES: YbaB/EbfC family nucleoid-associated protein [Crateriforma]|uniref:Nucleoid-associated protein YbaB n=1 Tax=Crateriforma conspicua TaxID=2527996 RepID=A0A5C6FXL3_9PLAN|nr:MULTISPECIES: YbaB/EbfC family nucleoid-associated protein [Crateriforma]TWU65783.1 Nucleoid-associated protein YbaB [Crateriforma conspicua]